MYKRQYDGKAMLRCYQCANWFHEDCMRKYEEIEQGQVWSCLQCRAMPSLVRDLYKMIETLLSTVNTMKETQADMKTGLCRN